MNNDKYSRMKEAAERAARIRQAREEVLARRQSKAEQNLRIEKRGDLWAIVRATDGQAIILFNSDKLIQTIRQAEAA